MTRLLLAALLALSPVEGLLTQDKAAVDQPMKDFKLRNLMKDGDEKIALSDYKDKKTVVLIFTSYNCDACGDYENRMLKVIKDFAGKDVVFLGVRSSAEDDAAGMKKYATEKGFQIPFLEDAKNVMADYLDVLVTPTFAVIDPKGVLRYRGALDDSLKEARAQKPYLRDAIQAVLEGKEVALKTTRTIGCHMPRVEPGK
jgi:peroxiredoxin